MINAICFLEPKGTIFEVVKAAKEQGLYTIAFVNNKERFLHEPEPYLTSAKDIDKVILIPSDKESILDITANLEASYKIVGVYSGIDATMPITATLRKKYNLPTSSEETIELILNKLKLRKLLNKKGLSNIFSCLLNLYCLTKSKLVSDHFWVASLKTYVFRKKLATSKACLLLVMRISSFFTSC